MSSGYECESHSSARQLPSEVSMSGVADGDSASSKHGTWPHAKSKLGARNVFADGLRGADADQEDDDNSGSDSYEEEDVQCCGRRGACCT